MISHYDAHELGEVDSAQLCRVHSVDDLKTWQSVLSPEVYYLVRRRFQDHMGWIIECWIFQNADEVVGSSLEHRAKEYCLVRFAPQPADNPTSAPPRRFLVWMSLGPYHHECLDDQTHLWYGDFRVDLSHKGFFSSGTPTGNH